MKNPYFKTIEIEKNLIKDFLTRHSELSTYIDSESPFFVRVSKKIYAGLIHTIISDNASNNDVITQWSQLIDFIKKIKPKNILSLSMDKLTKIVGEQKARIINRITKDVDNKDLNLKNLAKQSQEVIYSKLSQYSELSRDLINKFMLFCCFKQDVLCEDDEDFLKGLQIFLKKEKIEQDDIKNIKIKYKGELTIFSLCMWRIRNERKE